MSAANKDTASMAAVAGVALWLTFMPVQTSHLISALVGVASYLVLQSLQLSVATAPRQPKCAGMGGAGAAQHGFRSSRQQPPSTGPRQGSPSASARASADRPAGRAPPRAASQAAGPARAAHLRRLVPTLDPVMAPAFEAVGWDAEVQEMLGRIMPTAEGGRIVRQIEQSVEKIVRGIIPEARVTGHTAGNITARSAFGVAVPDVDVVISVEPSVLLDRLQGRWLQKLRGSHQLEPNVVKLQKSAIRACTDRLVGTGLFKFRRSAFRGREPKVTIITPSMFGPNEQGVPVNLMVNAASPLQSAAMLATCEHLAPQAKALTLLVRRWAKDRGLCHSAKGHLSPYAWNVLVTYFLQVAALGEDGEPVLPPLRAFQSASGPAVLPAAMRRPAAAPQRAGVGELFKRFVRFYAADFHWGREVVSVRAGNRDCQPGARLPVAVLAPGGAGGRTTRAPCIEDPFDEAHNLGAGMSLESLQRLRKELRRADDLCSEGSSLTVLLEPWVPPEAARSASEGSDDAEEWQGQ